MRTALASCSHLGHVEGHKELGGFARPRPKRLGRHEEGRMGRSWQQHEGSHPPAGSIGGGGGGRAGSKPCASRTWITGCEHIVSVRSSPSCCCAASSAVSSSSSKLPACPLSGSDGKPQASPWRTRATLALPCVSASTPKRATSPAEAIRGPAQAAAGNWAAGKCDRRAGVQQARTRAPCRHGGGVHGRCVSQSPAVPQATLCTLCLDVPRLTWARRGTGRHRDEWAGLLLGVWWEDGRRGRPNGVSRREARG